MQRYRFLWALLLATLLFGAVSCSNDDALSEAPADNAQWTLPEVPELQQAIIHAEPAFSSMRIAIPAYVTALSEAYTLYEAETDQSLELLEELQGNAAGDFLVGLGEVMHLIELSRAVLDGQLEHLVAWSAEAERTMAALHALAERSLSTEEWAAVTLEMIDLHQSLCTIMEGIAQIDRVVRWYLPDYEYSLQGYLTGQFTTVANSLTDAVHDQLEAALAPVRRTITTLRRSYPQGVEPSFTEAFSEATEATNGWLPRRLMGVAPLVKVWAEAEAMMPLAQATDAQMLATLASVKDVAQQGIDELKQRYRKAVEQLVKGQGRVDQVLNEQLLLSNTRADRIATEEHRRMADYLPTELDEPTSIDGLTIEDCVTLTIDRFDGRYEAGETVVVKAVSSVTFETTQEVYINGNLTTSEQVVVRRGVNDLLTRTDHEAVSVIVRLKHPTNTKDYSDIGYCVAIDRFRPGFQKPADFYQWWTEQVAMLRTLPIEVKMVEVEVPSNYASTYVCYDLEVNCGEGGAPVRGYLAMPKGADPKSLPICLFTHGAGVNGTANRSRIEVALQYARQGGGSISLDLNAHGMLNGQPQSYYDELNATTLKDYRNWPILDRESYYYRGMYLRVQRAIDYLCTRPEWNGERILVIGSSQGGAQTSAICGLDSRVTHALIRAPGMMDLGGRLLGRQSGPPLLSDLYGFTEPFMQWGPYFDTAFFLEHNHAKILYECGFIDRTCIPSATLSGYNLAVGEKELLTYPYREHSSPTGKYKAAWSQYVNARISAFIREALK